MLNKCREQYSDKESVDMCLATSLAGKKVSNLRANKQGLDLSNVKWHHLPFPNKNHPSLESTISIYPSAALCLEERRKDNSNCTPNACWYGENGVG